MYFSGNMSQQGNVRKIVGYTLCMCMVIMLVGCGGKSSSTDTASENKLSENSQTLENSETQSSQDSQSPSETEGQKPSETQKPSESETQKPSESETQKPSESETQKPSESETQKPSESETQKPSESETQKPSESETQKPSESETQKPSESEIDTEEPSETETEEPNEKYEKYILSTQNYDFARQVSEKYYLVSEDECYGLVDFNGNVIVPIEYEIYKLVSENEIEFEDGGEEFYIENFGWLEKRNAYVYSTDTGKLLFQYVSSSMTHWENKHRETIVGNGVEHKILYGDPDSDPLGCFEGDPAIKRSYQNGLIMETYLVFDCADIYKYGAEPRNYISFTEAKTGKLIYEGYTTIGGYEYYYEESGEWYEEYREGEPQVALVSSDKSEGKAAMLEYSIQEDKYYLVLVSLDGYVKHEIQDISIFDSSIGYSGDWLKMPWTAKMINTKTMEIVEMPIEEEKAGSWYVGRGEFYALTDDESSTTYTIYKGNKSIATGYTQLYFTKHYIIGRNSKGKFDFIDYTGKTILNVTDYGDTLNDRYLVSDGVGVYYVDKTLKRVSDYIYKGNVEDCRSGAIMIDEKYYLIAKK